MMSVPAALQNMQVVDILRSGALVLAFLAVSFGYRKSNGASKWLYVDSLSSALFGFGFLLFPDVLLGHMVYGKLDPVHTLFTRVFGALLLSSSCVSYYFAGKSVNKSQRVITQSLVLCVLVMSMGMAQLKSQQGGRQKFNDQHVTFGMLGAGLWFLGNFVQVFRASDLGQVASRGFSLRNRADIFAFIDMMLLVTVALQAYAFPSFLFSKITYKGWKMDLVHAHMCRTVAVMSFGMALGYLQSFLNGSASDRHAAVLGRVVQIVVALPVVMAYQWWFQLYDNQFFTMLTLFFQLPVALLVGAAYYAGFPKQKKL